MSNRTISLTESLYEYLLSVSLREPDLLRQLREETAAQPDARMQISPEQGQFMGLLARLMGARRCLEIGVFTGYSSLAVALALPDAGRIVACDVSERWTAVARRYWAAAGVAHKIDLRLAPALETLAQLRAAGETGSYDFVFIDADKENYVALLRARAGTRAPGRPGRCRQHALVRPRRRSRERRARHRGAAAFQRAPAPGRAHRPEPRADRRRADTGEEERADSG